MHHASHSESSVVLTQLNPCPLPRLSFNNRRFFSSAGETGPLYLRQAGHRHTRHACDHYPAASAWRPCRSFVRVLRGWRASEERSPVTRNRWECSRRPNLPVFPAVRLPTAPKSFLRQKRRRRKALPRRRAGPVRCACVVLSRPARPPNWQRLRPRGDPSFPRFIEDPRPPQETTAANYDSPQRPERRNINPDTTALQPTEQMWRPRQAGRHRPRIRRSGIRRPDGGGGARPARGDRQQMQLLLPMLPTTIIYARMTKID